MEKINEAGIRGYTKIEEVFGQGSVDGEPHLGTHVWPEVNSLIFTAVDDEKMEKLLKGVREIESKFSDEGIHAFVLNLEKMI
jgi:hypothetical protein